MRILAPAQNCTRSRLCCAVWDIALLLLLSVPSAIAAPSAARGDIAAAFNTGSDVIPSGSLALFASDGTPKAGLAVFAAAPLALAADQTGNIHVTFENHILVVAPDGTVQQSYAALGGFMTGLVFAANRHVFVGAPYNNAVPTSRNIVQEYDASGALVRSFRLPMLAGDSLTPFDLALDSNQCTLYYTTLGRRVGRFDVCVNQPLSDLLSDLPGSRAYRTRILADDSLLIANEEMIVRVGRSGHIIQTYVAPGLTGWRSLALTQDGSSFWVSSTTGIALFTIAGVLQPPHIDSVVEPTSMIVIGEYQPITAAIPSLSVLALALLSVSIGIVALVRIRGN